MPSKTTNAPAHSSLPLPHGVVPHDCRQLPGNFEPVIDRNRCEGKGPCVPACPFGVLSLGIIGAEERRQLSFMGHVKAWAHGGRQAFPIHLDACSACGECVRVCPEHAITLRRRPQLSFSPQAPSNRKEYP